jgi:serine/threonine protein kinase
VGFREAFFHDGHVCTACELHGRSLDALVDRGPLPLREVRIIARQILGGLVRMHENDLAHTDVKPMNILYRRTPQPRAKLADLGNADHILRRGSNRGTREYTAPEVLLGNPLDPRMDLWSLACTVFEVATGHNLFSPYEAAERKYAEFSGDIPEEAFDPSVAEDSAEEDAEQYRPGTIIAGKYRLEARLGQGSFATVWRASVLHEEPLIGTYAVLSAHCDALEAGLPPSARRVGDEEARAWHKARGARDLHDLVLNYEHLVQMQDLLGPPPAAWAAQGLYASAYCSAEGLLKHDPAPAAPVTLEARICAHGIDVAEARALADFLRPMLEWDPTQRLSAPDGLAHEWCRS